VTKADTGLCARACSSLQLLLRDVCMLCSMQMLCPVS